MDPSVYVDNDRYAMYLLENYNALMRDIEQYKLELLHFENQIDSIEDSDASNNDYSIGNGSAVSFICQIVNKRLRERSADVCKKMILTSEIEFKKLNAAINSLKPEIKNIIVDLYIHELKWDQVCIKHYISNNTLNRYRKKGIFEISKAFRLEGVVA